MKIYTKTGDGGTTSLIGGERVEKCDPRVEAYGTVDELMAFVALMTDTLMEDERTICFVEHLQRIESQLMTASALFAVGKGGEGKVASLKADASEELEQAIDAMQESLPEITKFTIPGGDVRCSLCHVCRTVCRRAERASICASQEYDIDPSATIYLNRLSDYFYLLGRTITQMASIEEILWIP